LLKRWKEIINTIKEGVSEPEVPNEVIYLLFIYNKLIFCYLLIYIGISKEGREEGEDSIRVSAYES